jgi:hypothetical protein
MKKKYFLIISIMTVFLFFSCAEGNKKIDISKDDGELLLSSIGDSITYIQLETNDECLVGRINKTLYDRNIIYILDPMNRCIWLFNDKGKFISRFSKWGQGPGEYIGLETFTVKNGIIYILDFMYKKILRYNNAGQFLGEVKIEDYPRDFAVIDENNYLLYMPDKNIGHRRGLYLFNAQNNSYSQIYEIETIANDAIYANYYIMKPKDGLLSIMNNFNNVIIHLDENNSIKERLHFDITPVVTDFGTQSLEKYTLSQFVETKKFILLLYMPWSDERIDEASPYANDYKELKFYLYNKTSKSGKVYSSINNGMDSNKVGWFMNLNYLGDYDDCLVFNLPPEELDENGQENNSILQIVHLKK